jgi:hypothetical protein
MEIHWGDLELKKRLESAEFLERKYDKKVARQVSKRLRELGAFRHYGLLPGSMHSHPLNFGKEGKCFAVDVPGIGEKRGKLRLLFRPYGDHDISRVETITKIVIIDLRNYH